MKKQIYKALPIALVSQASLISSPAIASGFQLSEYSATGLGRAYAGESAIADNAASQWRNPALLSFIEGTQISGGVVYVDPDVDVEGTYTNDTYGMNYSASSEDYVDSGVIPNIYLSHQINDKWAIGLAGGTNYGMSTDLGEDFMGSSTGDTAEIITTEMNLNLAYMITESFSIGGGIRYVMAEGSFGSTWPGSDTVLGFVEGDTEEWGWQLGAAWQINEKNRLGLTYKSEVNLNLEGTAEHIVVGSDTGSLELTLPATAELAYAFQATEQLLLSVSLNWTDWSSFDELNAELDSYDVTIYKYEGWEDSYRLAVGAEYQLNSKWTVRSGAAYDQSAVDDEDRTATIPETSRYWVTAGAGFSPNERLTIDAGLAYILSEDATIEDEGSLDGVFTGETNGSIWLAGIQASYKF
ncbi:OmpP1/FadL family transporter [Reinekea marinisedimentorum]|uniref:Long-chain fatty acid transport protein n=1 Tax=Reinekea marinisedimentorum TaxID=230495 RepID=A0A4R3IE51_9GAMM|nr:outer membrane protein transport protein [Reinekea marinisedimentorum]TCS43061.1 long-chain fatty acid transport protein [Reinekea marinisedimentorum]